MKKGWFGAQKGDFFNQLAQSSEYIQEPFNHIWYLLIHQLLWIHSKLFCSPKTIFLLLKGAFCCHLKINLLLSGPNWRLTANIYWAGTGRSYKACALKWNIYATIGWCHNYRTQQLIFFFFSGIKMRKILEELHYNCKFLIKRERKSFRSRKMK